MKYSDFEKDKLYKVVKGNNGTLKAGDIFWIDSIRGDLNVYPGRGALHKEECDDRVFCRVDIVRATEYYVYRERWASGIRRCDK